jgi:hypothetical protein
MAGDPEGLRASAGDEVRMSDGVQVAGSGPTAGGTLKIGARREGWERNQDVSEVDAAKRFSSLTGRDWVLFEKQLQGSDIDVVARSEDGKRAEQFQITVLYDQNFWEDVNTKKAADVDLTREDVVSLIQKAVDKKKNRYPLAQRQRAILLIDLVPGGMLRQFAAHARQVLRSLLQDAAFRETWLVGSTADQLFQLWP